ncbi:hypothetical protein [Shimwellia pseudoproteus]|nr:hypothetical protein [Shimwellia pseudoproteus]
MRVNASNQDAETIQLETGRYYRPYLSLIENKNGVSEAFWATLVQIVILM